MKPPELLLVAVTTLIATAAVTAVVVLVLRWARRMSLAARLAVVLAGALFSIAASTIAVALEMYLSGHDVAILASVIGFSAIVSMAAAWLVARSAIRRPVASLVDSARRVGDGAVISVAPTGWPELDAVAAELADTSLRLEQARAQVAALDDARKQFFAWISHDLRTPLAGMRAMAEALESGTAPDPDAYIRLIRSKVDTVARMVSDLFELSQLQTGTLELHPEVVDLLDLVSDAVSDLQPIADSRHIRITQEGVDGRMVLADPRELTRAVGNVLANSVRHAPDHSTVLIRADTADDDLVLSVIDEGPGVTAENLGRMFDIGWRADPTRASEAGDSGAGLGLAIVRGIVEAHGGQVHVGRGSEGFQFDLILPTKESPPG